MNGHGPRRWSRPQLPLKNWGLPQQQGGAPISLDYPEHLLACLHSVGSTTYRREDHSGRNRPASPIGRSLVTKLTEELRQQTDSASVSRGSSHARATKVRPPVVPDAKPTVGQSLHLQLIAIEQYLQHLFAATDPTDSRTVPVAQLSRLLELSDFHVPPAITPKLIAAARTNHDGLVEYTEFIPVAMGILRNELMGASSNRPSPNTAIDALEEASFWCQTPQPTRIVTLGRTDIGLGQLHPIHQSRPPSQLRINRQTVQSAASRRHGCKSAWSIF
jgi:hypothetical protein